MNVSIIHDMFFFYFSYYPTDHPLYSTNNKKVYNVIHVLHIYIYDFSHLVFQLFDKKLLLCWFLLILHTNCVNGVKKHHWCKKAPLVMVSNGVNGVKNDVKWCQWCKKMVSNGVNPDFMLLLYWKYV